jgi:hypothetical protein
MRFPVVGPTIAIQQNWGWEPLAGLRVDSAVDHGIQRQEFTMRQFLFATGAVALAALTAGCGTYYDRSYAYAAPGRDILR